MTKKTKKIEKALVIVESPAKAKTINKILGSRFTVKACMGHVRDLPERSFGIDIEQGFIPKYQAIRGKAKTIKELKEASRSSSAVYLAPDPDREGEAIAWHLVETLKIPPAKVHRVTFNEITPRSVQAAFDKPKQISMDRVNAQQARRLLDRIVGYKLSPLLWKKVGKGLSAGRVQSVAVRLLVEREKEIQAFKAEEYWTIGVRMKAGAAGEAVGPTLPAGGTFLAELRKVDGKEVALKTKEETGAIADRLRRASYRLTDVAQKKKVEAPPAPFTTSLLQQQASIHLRFSTKKTMMIAQQLYEGVELGAEGAVGLITYMRTDSVRVAPEAMAELRAMITEKYGRRYLSKEERAFKAKRGAQEAHEAIRPASVLRTPEEIKASLTEDQFKLYRLIWRRFVSSQMSAAEYLLTDAEIEADLPPSPAAGAAELPPSPSGLRGTSRGTSGGGSVAQLQAKGRELKFEGYTAVAGHRLKKDEQILPPLRTGEPVRAEEVLPEQHFTQPPPRFSEASLVKAMEKFGIGRPSTYAPIISTIQERGYVRQEQRKLFATELGILVTEKLLQYFDDIMNLDFTAKMEEDLDKIEEAKADWVDILKLFYKHFEQDLSKALVEMESAKGQAPEVAQNCDKCAKPMVVRWNKSGKFLGCSGFPECRSTKSLSEPEATQEKCEKCASPMVIRSGRRGRFMACSAYPNCRNTRPVPRGNRRVVIPQGFKEACEKCGKDIVVKYGRRGGFLACSGYPECKNTKSFPKEWIVEVKPAEGAEGQEGAETAAAEDAAEAE